jgi:asparagine synthase (glutamine-hydrolysing)
MCGINAIFAYHPNAPLVAEKELILVRDAMKVRGPDGAGVWFNADKRIGLGHRRLAIIDIAGGIQPMMLNDTQPDRVANQPVICFNGEIYNYRELRDELIAEGRQFKTTSDTEVLLHLYDRDGPSLVQRLRGMFAFALWDPVRQGLLLARDHFGIKPLYYADNGKTLRVASQVKALLQSRHAIDTEPQAAGHVGFFLCGYVPEPYTLYRGIHSLPAGSTLWIDQHGNRELKRFFNLTEELATVSDSTLHRKDWQEQLRSALINSVTQHLIADVPVGIFLSAGLDSTTIAALAQETSQIELKSVTLGFDEYRGQPEDETILAEQVARQLHTYHQTGWIKADDFRSQYENLLTAMDQPSVDGVNTYFVAKVAAETGLKVALSGLGGDELLGGYPSFRQIPRLVRTLAPFRFIPQLGRGFRMVTAQVAARFTSPKYAGLLEYGTRYGDAYLLRRGLFMPWELPKILDPDLVKAGWQTWQPTLQFAKTIEGLTTSRQKIAALELSWYMCNQLLRDADWAGMAHSLEIRTPLVDVQLFRTLAPLLAHFPPPTKRDLANTLHITLPKAVLERTKTGFSVPIRNWILPDTQPGERGLRGYARLVYNHINSE